MRSECANWPDWRDPGAFAPLVDADRSLFAWEWLRRDPLYRKAAEASLSGSRAMAEAAPGPEQFGLAAFEPPNLTVPNARPMWRSDVHPFVLPVDVARPPFKASDGIDMRRLRHIARILPGAQSERLLLSDGFRAIRLDGPPGAFSSGPVCLRYALCGLASAKAPLLTLRRLLALGRSGQFSSALHRREPRARRWILILRARDALAAGASQRDIAQVLLSRSAVEPGWRSSEPSLRSRAQRLVGSARAHSAGGYRSFLQ